MARLGTIDQQDVGVSIATVAAGRRRRAEWRGRLAEWVAAASLVLKGYRILARRHRGPLGEIDLIAVRGKRLAFVEVKQRCTTEAGATALTVRQSRRLASAAAHWLWHHPRYRDHRVGLDAVLVGPTFRPIHKPGALHAW